MKQNICRNLIKEISAELFSRVFSIKLIFSFCLILGALASILEPLSIKYFTTDYYILFLLWYSFLGLSLIISYEVVRLALKFIRKPTVIMFSSLAIFLHLTFLWWQYGNLLSNFTTIHDYHRFTVSDALGRTYLLGIILVLVAIISFKDNFKRKSKNDLVLVSDDLKESIYLEKSRVLYFESKDHEVEIYSIYKKGKIKVKKLKLSLNNLQDQLNEELFLRCHKSYIINKNYVEAIIGDTQNMEIKISKIDVLIPVARSKINLILINLPALHQS